jgi:hypothetical protein
MLESSTLSAAGQCRFIAAQVAKRVPLETTSGEARVAVTPETAKKLKAQGHVIRVQSGAGVAASVIDEAYTSSSDPRPLF